MYKIKGFSSGKEYQCMVSSFSSAFKILKKSRKNANSIQILDEKGLLKAVYLKGLGKTMFF